MHLEDLLTALDASPAALRREMVGRPAKPVGNLAIIGKSGHIYPDGDGFLLYVTTNGSVRRWGGVKKRLAFCRLTQDGDDEGCLHLDRLPTPTKADLIREAIGVRRRRHLSPEELARSTLNLQRARAG